MRLLVIRSKSSLSIKGRSTLVIKNEKGDKERALRDIDSVLIIGSNILIDSSVPAVLSMHNIPLAIIAKNNTSLIIDPIMTRYNNYRRLQYLLDKNEGLIISFEYIKAKVVGMLNILKYHKMQYKEIEPFDISNHEELESRIRLWESQSSNTIWDDLKKLIKNDVVKELEVKYGFNGRKPRNNDPFNKSLSVMYAVLYSLSTKALLSAGLDPTYGFLHKTKYSTPLTFDFSEMFKPIAIQATIELLNKEGIPELAKDGELTKESVNHAIKILYNYLILRNKENNKTPYQQIFLKAFCLAKYLERKCELNRLSFTWNRAQYKG